MRNKQVVEMSPQQSIDCDTNNYGCSGGWPYAGISYLAAHGGLSSLNDYPMRKNYSGPCEFDSSKAKVTIKGYMNVTKNETIIKDALYELGPLSVLMDFTGLHYYKSGVASPLLCSTWPDHALLLAGYGTFKNDDYWLIKNSWGASWGQSGYLMLARGKTKCAISEFATTAVLA